MGSSTAPVQAIFLLAAALAGGSAARSLSAAPPTSSASSDADILNFALNLEYLEAEFYSCAAFSRPLPSNLRGGGPASTGCKQATLSDTGKQIAAEIATNEIAHVTLLRNALGANAVPIPQLDVGPAFADVLTAALGGPVSPPYSPYDNDISFLLGAFIFEDVGVTAYEGAVGQITKTAYLQAAAKILAVEAYQSGVVRAFLYQANGQDNNDWPYQPTIASVVQAISDLRDSADGSSDDDQGIIKGLDATLVPVDGSSLVFDRTPDQVISIVTLGKGPAGGGFFPEGLNTAASGDASSASQPASVLATSGSG